MKCRFVKILLILLVVQTAGTAFAEDNCKEVILKQADKQMMDTYFSNFSEVFVEPFEKDGINDSSIIKFAVSHNYRNNEKRFVKGGKEYQVKIKASYIDESAEKFFGKKIKMHQSVEGIDYKDGWYFITNASGEVYNFSQILSLCDKGNGFFSAKVNIYSAGSGWTGNVHGTEKEWRKESPDDVPRLSEVISATLRKVKGKGQARYILIDYLKVK